MLLYIKTGKVDQIAVGNKKGLVYKACDVLASLMVFRLLLFWRHDTESTNPPQLKK